LICVISKTDRQRQYNWNIVESGIKHHNPSWDKTSVTNLCFSRSTIFDRLVKECSNSLKALNCIKTYQECSFNRFLLFCFSIDLTNHTNQTNDLNYAITTDIRKAPYQSDFTAHHNSGRSDKM
jgi:hypothetical protein